MLQNLLPEQCADLFGFCANYVPPPTVSEFGSTRGIGAIPLPISVAAPSLISAAAPSPISVAAPSPISVVAPSPVLVRTPLPVYVPPPVGGPVPEMPPLGMMLIGFGAIALVFRQGRTRVPRFLFDSALEDSGGASDRGPISVVEEPTKDAHTITRFVLSPSQL
jgi:hypothetical protein